VINPPVGHDFQRENGSLRYLSIDVPCIIRKQAISNAFWPVLLGLSVDVVRKRYNEVRIANPASWGSTNHTPVFFHTDIPMSTSTNIHFAAPEFLRIDLK
jgi:hypothetical protein